MTRRRCCCVTYPRCTDDALVCVSSVDPTSKNVSVSGFNGSWWESLPGSGGTCVCASLATAYIAGHCSGTIWMYTDPIHTPWCNSTHSFCWIEGFRSQNLYRRVVVDFACHPVTQNCSVSVSLAIYNFIDPIWTCYQGGGGFSGLAYCGKLAQWNWNGGGPVGGPFTLAPTTKWELGYFPGNVCRILVPGSIVVAVV